MMKRNLAVGLTLCLAAAWFTGCSLFKSSPQGVHAPSYEFIGTLRSNIKETIADPDKADDLLELAAGMESELIELDRTARRYYERLAALDADYEATQEDFHRAIDEYNQERVKLREQLLEHRFGMRDLVTAEEWEDLADLDQTLLESWQREPATP